MTEWTGSNTDHSLTQESINEGIGNIVQGRSGTISATVADISTPSSTQSNMPGLCNVRQAYIHGISTQLQVGAVLTQPVQIESTSGWGVVPNGNPQNPIVIAAAQGNAARITSTNPRKRYQVRLALGLFNQPKLIPTKFMASQLSIEITLENPSACMYTPAFQTTGPLPTYRISNVNLIPEILEFDATYGKLLFLSDQICDLFSHYPLLKN